MADCTCKTIHSLTPCGAGRVRSSHGYCIQPSYAILESTHNGFVIVRYSCIDSQSRAPSFTSLTNQRRLPCPENFCLSLKTGIGTLGNVGWSHPPAGGEVKLLTQDGSMRISPTFLRTVKFSLASVSFLNLSYVGNSKPFGGTPLPPSELAVDPPRHHGDNTSLEYIITINMLRHVC